MYVSDPPLGVGAVNVVPETPDPENVPPSPLPVIKVPEILAGVAVNVLVSPSHMAVATDVMFRLLFCLTLTVIEAEPPAKQLASLTCTRV